MIRKLIGLAGMVGLGVSLAVAPGCGDDKPDTQPEPERFPNVEAFCGEVAAAECKGAIEKACSFEGKGLGEACKAEVKQACLERKTEASREFTTSADFRKDKAAKCIEVIDAVYSAPENNRISLDQHKLIKEACGPVFRGYQTQGRSCSRDQECDVDLRCYIADLSTGKGTCETPKILVKGDDCISPGDFCGVGLYCSPADKICGGRRNLGDECEVTRPCIETSTCQNIDAMTGRGTCGPKKDNLVECTLDDECTSGFCALIDKKTVCTPSLTLGVSECKNFDGQ